MSLVHRFRDLLLPRREILKEVGIKPGFRVLDYGCGSGSYTLPLEELVGESGEIYALDTNQLAIQSVQNIIIRKQLANVKTIHSDRETGLPDSSMDVVLLYDVLHALSDPDGVLAELHRVIKPYGILSLSDHHMTENEIVTKVEGKGLFRLLRKGERTYSFKKNAKTGV